jgi:hypothetical protein
MKTIKLTRGFETIVDDDIYDLYNWYSWCYFPKGVAARRGRKGEPKVVYLHRAVVKCPVELQVDHINGNKLDNRRENLRICTNAQNCANQTKRCNNTTGAKGVTYRNNKYEANISVNSKRIWLGTYDTLNEAANAYDRAAKLHHAEFANVNNLKDDTGEVGVS